MSDRERLVKMMRAGDGCTDGQTYERLADRLLAAGIKLPPAPEPLVNTQLRNEIVAAHHRRDVDVPLPLANALVAAAIRRAVERKTTNGVVGISAESPNGLAYGFSPSRILALFGLEAP